MKLSTVVLNALNGDADRVDPAVRRSLIAMANELDEQSEDWDKRIGALQDSIDTAVDSIRADVKADVADLREDFQNEVKGVRKLLLGLTTTVVGGILIGVVNILIQGL